MSESKQMIARAQRYKKSALEDMDFEHMTESLYDMREACDEVMDVSRDDNMLLDALDGDEELAFEFKMAFADLSGDLCNLEDSISDMYRYDEEKATQEYNDCTVALVGETMNVMGYDEYETDYFRLVGYDTDLAEKECGKRLMRNTKQEMLNIIGRNMRLFLAYYDLKQRFESLDATMQVIRGSNQSLLKVIKQIEETYERADEASTGFKYEFYPECKEFDALLKQLPDRFWIE